MLTSLSPSPSSSPTCSVTKRRRADDHYPANHDDTGLYDKLGSSKHHTAISFDTVVTLLRVSEVYTAKDVQFARNAARIIADNFESAVVAVTAMKTALAANPDCLSTVLPFLVDEIEMMKSTHSDDVLASVDSELELVEAFRHAMCHLVNVGNWLQAAGSLIAQPFSGTTRSLCLLSGCLVLFVWY